jgi:predicted ABC-type transport system involved in lysophospholipase L1 biosynthesis ATPase subunit
MPPTPSDAPIVSLREVQRTYGPPSAPVAALRGVTLAFQPGERVALVGKSGSGKSTLLNLLGGLDRPTAGSVEVAGRDLARLNARALADYRLRTVGVVFQAFNLMASCTALQNVELPMLFAGVPPRERREKARRALAEVGLAGRVHHRPAEMSGGEGQRVAIARALVNEPAVVLADEPTGNLDSPTAAVVMDLLLGHVRARGMTLVLVTHDEELARRTADRIVRLADGRLVG